MRRVLRSRVSGGTQESFLMATFRSIMRLRTAEPREAGAELIKALSLDAGAAHRAVRWLHEARRH